MPSRHASSDGAVIDIETESQAQCITFTTNSNIHGQVHLHAVEEILLESVRISLLGCAEKSLELTKNGNRSRNERSFLRIDMPREGQNAQNLEVLCAGQQKSIPFDFRFPQQLPTGTCAHTEIEPYLQEQHLRLPPTMGSSKDVDHMCPDFVSVSYYIEVEAVIKSPDANTEQNRCLRRRLPITVLPSFPEEAPMDLDSQYTNFMPREKLSLKRDLFDTPNGDLYVKAHQPNTIMLSVNDYTPTTSSLYIEAHFASRSEAVRLPELKRVSVQIISNTYFGPRVLHQWPQRAADAHHKIEPLLNYKVTIPILDHTPGNSKWSLVDVPAMSDSTATYKTTLNIPFSLPNVAKKQFLPTFHCCLFSRTYTPALKISITKTQKMNITVPLQIGVQAAGTSEPSERAELPDYASWR